MSQRIIPAQKLSNLPTLASIKDEMDPIVVLRIFHPVGAAVWHVAAGTPTKGGDVILFVHANLGDDQNAEWGHQSLQELESLVLMGCKPEMDRYFTAERASKLGLVRGAA